MGELSAQLLQERQLRSVTEECLMEERHWWRERIALGNKHLTDIQSSVGTFRQADETGTVFDCCLCQCGWNVNCVTTYLSARCCLCGVHSVNVTDRLTFLHRKCVLSLTDYVVNSATRWNFFHILWLIFVCYLARHLRIGSQDVEFLPSCDCVNATFLKNCGSC